MNAPAPIHTDSATPAPSPTVEHQLAALALLADAGVKLAVSAGREAERERAPGEAAADLPALSLAYTRVSRAVRLAIMLQAELTQERAAADKAASDEAAALKARLDPENQHKARVERIVGRMAMEQCGSAERIESLMTEAGDRLDDPDMFEGVLDRPIGELVAIICRDLRLKPDWARLGEEPWALHEIAQADPRSPFAERMAGVELDLESGLPPTRPPPPAGEGDP